MPSFLEALLAYWGSAVRPKTPLARRIVWLLAFKLVALSLLWILFFGPASRRPVNDAVIENSLFQSGAMAPTRESLR
jgi:hypothetical protein